MTNDAGNAAVAKPTRVFITQHLVQHDMKEYPMGTEFPSYLATEEQIAALRKGGALKLREEMEAADTIAERIAAKEAENAALRAELEALKAKPAAEAEPVLAAAEAERATKAAAVTTRGSKATTSAE